MVLVSALPLRAVVPVFVLFAPKRPLLTGSLGESARGGEWGSGEPEEEACLGLAPLDILPSSPKLDMQYKSNEMVTVSWILNLKPEKNSSKMLEVYDDVFEHNTQWIIDQNLAFD